MKRHINGYSRVRNGKVEKVRDHERIYDDYNRAVNMRLKELKKWAENPCSNQASIGRDAIDRNLNLLSKPKFKWTEADYNEAKKTISFNRRMIKNKEGKDRFAKVNTQKINCGSGRNISLRNWAKEVNKKERDRIYGDTSKAETQPT